MITNVSLVTVWVADQDSALDFYVNKLGFVLNTDFPMGPVGRWLTVNHPDHPELELTLMKPGPPIDADAAEFLRVQLAKGGIGGLGLKVDDCHKAFDELSAKGVEFIQQPTDRPYGVEAVIRDDSGNWLVLVEPREFTPEQ